MIVKDIVYMYINKKYFIYQYEEKNVNIGYIFYGYFLFELVFIVYKQ